jgi:hypothetical protein
MGLVKSLSLLLVTCSLLAAQDLPDDPVMKARSQRAKAQGLNEADLPPMARPVTEPPPLPPPETHHKDTRAGRQKLSHRKSAKGGRHRHSAAEPAEPRKAKAGKHPKSGAKVAPRKRKKRKA